MQEINVLVRLYPYAYVYATYMNSYSNCHYPNKPEVTGVITHQRKLYSEVPEPEYKPLFLS